MLTFRIIVPGVTTYIGVFPGQLQAAADAERRFPDAPPATTMHVALKGLP
ncbi:hypothetical protein SAMN05216344_106101 [Polaromonas sp. OV174]|nr:hypothetical protein [Polaromonas sp. OV174]SFB96142.1 hypothetical protein SAMN05216344_106101 [Polaromonas sp. OV174]